jgi:hypothetical protein
MHPRNSSTVLHQRDNRYLRTLPPVSKAQLAKIERPEKISQTALSHFDACPRSALLYWKHKGGPQTAAMARGEVFHHFVEQSVEQLVEAGEKQMPPEVAKANIMALIGERTDLHLPEYEQNALRAMAWNWAEATMIDPDQIVGLEQMIELEIGDWIVRGKLDFAEIGPFGALVRDYKTSIAMPSQDEIENGAKSFQGRFYALLLLFGIPEGETLSLGKGLDECRVELVYPRFTNSETGELISREVTWNRDQLTDFRNTLQGHLERITHGFDSGEWPAQAGSHCSICPAQHECPIPEQLRPRIIESVDEATEALELHFTRDAEQRKLMKAVSAFHEDYAAPIFMGDYSYDRRLEERRNVDWEAAGDGPVLPEHISIVPSTPFRKRKQTPEERESRNGG